MKCRGMSYCPIIISALFCGNFKPIEKQHRRCVGAGLFFKSTIPKPETKEQTCKGSVFICSNGSWVWFEKAPFRTSRSWMLTLAPLGKFTLPTCRESITFTGFKLTVPALKPVAGQQDPSGQPQTGTLTWTLLFVECESFRRQNGAFPHSQQPTMFLWLCWLLHITPYSRQGCRADLCSS